MSVAEVGARVAGFDGAPDGIVAWGEVPDSITTDSDDGVRTWDVSGSENSFVEIPVTITPPDSEPITITLPLYLSDNVQPDADPALCDYTGVVGENWEVDQTDDEVIVRYLGSVDEETSDDSVTVVYKFDRWDVISGEAFTLPYVVSKDAPVEEEADGVITLGVVDEPTDDPGAELADEITDEPIDEAGAEPVAVPLDEEVPQVAVEVGDLRGIIITEPDVEQEPYALDGDVRLMEAAEGAAVTWGDGDLDTVTPLDDGGVRTWNLSGTPHRMLDAYIKISVSSAEDVTITLDRYIDDVDNIRPGADKAAVSTKAVEGLCEVTKNEKEIVLKFRKTDQGGAHKTFQLAYSFDCWNVISGRNFSIHYEIENGNVPTTGDLTGKIITGYNLEIVNYDSDDPYYYPNGRVAGYSLASFGGADNVTSYIQNWSTAYQKYFGFPEDQFFGSDDEYIYDIAPFFVKPTGQQPYDISGTVTVQEGAEILGGVYMMDSRMGSNAPWKTLKDTNNGNGKNNFDFSFAHNDNFDGPDTPPGSLIDKVVTGNLKDPVDNKYYTLYFLVRYKVCELDGKKVNNEQTTAYTLKANLFLTHTGVDKEVDSGDIKTTSHEQVLYKGPTTDSQIYDAYYTYYLPNQQDALGNLDKNAQAVLDFQADFFCYNQARKDFNDGKNEKYRLEAVIDLLYLTGERPYETSERLNAGDYRFSQFKLSLVDAPGNWSQNWYYEERNKEDEKDDEVWREQRPNVGWPVETWEKDEFDGYSKVVVYGNESLEGGKWTEIREFDVKDIWAKDQGRDVNDRRFTDNVNLFNIGEGTNYVRLKVVYDSRWTTALRINYQIQLLPEILNKHESLNGVTQHGLTAWFNYFGYTKNAGATDDSNKNWSADTENMACNRYPHFDGKWDYEWLGDGGEKQADKGSIEQARQYDKAQTEEMDFSQEFNTQDRQDDKSYSMRDYVRVMLGRVEDQAGMLITQALYGTDGTIVGNSENSTDPNGGSFCKSKEVTNVSEIVYSISGGITNGATNKESLDSRRAQDKEKNLNSPFNSLKMRYYVLLPDGFKLNKEAQPQNYDGDPRYLNTRPTFYDDAKGFGSGNTVPTSSSNIPAWRRLSSNGALSEMQWNDAGPDDSVTLNTDLTKGQLVVFDRTLTDTTLDDVFNLHGDTETYFWGRGLSFSVVPEKGVGSIRQGDYTTKVWCQYLDEQTGPLYLENFKKGIDNVNEQELNNAMGKEPNVEKNTLLYIPSTFTNRSPQGATGASISLDSGKTDEDGKPIVQLGEEYSYNLYYEVGNRSSENVVLWANIEQQYDQKPWYHGTVTGVSLADLPADVRAKVKVYVREDWFDESDYINSTADASRLTDENGWINITDKLDSYDRWDKVKAFAFYFDGVIFDTTTGGETISSANVKVKMRAPSREEYLDGPQGETYCAVSPLIFSDSQKGNDDKLENACTRANNVVVSVNVWTLIMPETDGPGITPPLVWGMLLCLIGGAFILSTFRRKRYPSQWEKAANSIPTGGWPIGEGRIIKKIQSMINPDWGRSP